MIPLKVLISGSGIGGPVCAYWLNRLSNRLIKTTIIERHAGLRKGGQQIDIRGAGIEVIRRMGCEEEIRSKTTQEKGIMFIDDDGKPVAEFPMRKGEKTFTSEFEILRESLVQTFYDASKDGTEYIFGNHIIDMEQDEDKVIVKLANGESRDFDYVIGADGMWSKTRRLAFADVKDPMKSLGLHIAFFSIPYEKRDGESAQWYNIEGGRSILIRPDNGRYTRAYMSTTSPKVRDYHQYPIAGQKALMREHFLDAGWDAPRIIKGMEEADDFYMQEVAQIKLPYFSRGRVALLGDAGYCPSLLSGMGTTLAIVGAYILAGEIVRAGPNYKEALQNYEEKMRPYVKTAQDLPPGVPAINNPQSKWGIKLFHKFLSFVSWSHILPLLSKLSSPPSLEKHFPIYEA
ncbi:Uncharacterized protein GcM3_114004 [Golovinomyces cichoracearum]|uniref:FAD-binding domain-containing protein n=1 Tax=Golovinomyces cichoracearum TaxID=62708 RepID=A0A420I8E6_9PEZI|nr:Uncharacterized protein GcM3_114004 [Golovinomyces cichoracearum]